ncbi:hypothetical protein [Butyrivibrio sp. FC2001]|uniref:hypothetical protein n=1 Tax=Butyrivibrio sp. FC2001 TaxID=1280671 RepID=UPI00042A1416|nr:hypothetical protein [Butyrivibrio sp. FC2001]
MSDKKDLSLLNCTISGLLAMVLSVPFHEFTHFLTDIIYGHEVYVFCANAVSNSDDFDFMALTPFHRAMAAGGSASIINVMIAIILFFIIIKVNMGPVMRMFMIQYYAMHMCLGFGYFMVNGIFGAFGDWGNVFGLFPDSTVMIMRIVLGTLGSAGILFTMFSLNYFSYYFIKDTTDKKERFHVGLGLHLLPFIATSVFSVIVDMNSYLMKAGYFDNNIFFSIAVRFIFIPLFWAFLYTWTLVKPPKEGRFKYELTKKPEYILWIITIILLLIDLFVLAPGIVINNPPANVQL